MGAERRSSRRQYRLGLSVYDLPDIDFRSLYDAGETAQTAAEEALAAADFPFDDLVYLD